MSPLTLLCLDQRSLMSLPRQSFLGSEPELQSYPFGLTNIPAGTGILVYFQVRVPANGLSGSFHQEVTIDLMCNTFD